MIAIVAAVLAATVALAALAPTAVLLLAVALAQGLLVSRWFAALGVTGAAGGAVVAGAAALTADVLVVVREDTEPLASVAAVLALAMLAAFLHQLVRRDGRPDLTASLAATTSLAVITVLGAGYLAADLSRGGSALVAVAALAAGAATALDAVTLPGPVRASIGLAAALVLSIAVGLLTDLGAAAAALVAAGCAATAAGAVTMARRMWHPEPIVCAALPLVLAGPAAFVLGRLLLG
jgi:hypothetical protein